MMWEGKVATSARAARLGTDLCREVGEVGDDHVREGARTTTSWGATCVGVVAMAVVGLGWKMARTCGPHLLAVKGRGGGKVEEKMIRREKKLKKNPCIVHVACHVGKTTVKESFGPR